MTAEEENLVLKNTGLVYSMANKYYIKLQNTMELEDLQSIAFIGLVKSAQSYNKDAGFAFSTYAYKVIKNEFNIHIRESMKHRYNISLATEVYEGVTLEDTISDDYDFFDDIELSFYKDKLYEALHSLPDTYRQIVEYKLQGLTFNQIGELIGCSYQNVQQLYSRIINILRYKLKDLRR